MITPKDNILSVEEQCKLLNLARSTYYYEACQISPHHLAIMKAIDKIYTAHPDKGKRRISADLKAIGYDVGVDLCRTLMRIMGIVAIYPKPNLSKRRHDHKVYPYLLNK